MSQQVVFNLLKRLNRPSDVDEIFNLAKEENLKGARDRVKIRDSLLLLSRKGYVKKDNGKWTMVSELPNL